ncbi:hypothetical protein V6B14_03840 [Sporosarcina psychrophila]|uniref:hypothetical protein n=1 Tax=Sporosarcina psychrophila TaxID=1476 RepID=UPI0030D2E41E
MVGHFDWFVGGFLVRWTLSGIGWRLSEVGWTLRLVRWRLSRSLETSPFVGHFPGLVADSSGFVGRFPGFVDGLVEG